MHTDRPFLTADERARVYVRFILEHQDGELSPKEKANFDKLFLRTAIQEGMNPDSTLKPKQLPIVSPEEIDNGILASELESLFNAKSDAERMLIANRLREQYGEKLKKIIEG